ncbi:hypothetical protein ACIQ9P_33180 [Kitasatospora sp. NPDC094019]|uniref:hypothetical protein n=1 Tax=Kitasatospora sp. NPDC094019 TaxID=3364091 RepID=UPI00382C7255
MQIPALRPLPFASAIQSLMKAALAEVLLPQYVPGPSTFSHTMLHRTLLLFRRLARSLTCPAALPQEKQGKWLMWTSDRPAPHAFSTLATMLGSTRPMGW